MDNFTGGVDDVWGNSGADMGNGLSDINPEDIESDDGPERSFGQAALYGSRAGNGVILITNQIGDGKTKGWGLRVNAGITAESIFLKPDMQNSFGQGSVGVYDNQSRLSWGPKAEGQTVTDWLGRKCLSRHMTISMLSSIQEPLLTKASVSSRILTELLSLHLLTVRMMPVSHRNRN